MGLAAATMSSGLQCPCADASRGSDSPRCTVGRSDSWKSRCGRDARSACRRRGSSGDSTREAAVRAAGQTAWAAFEWLCLQSFQPTTTNLLEPLTRNAPLSKSFRSLVVKPWHVDAEARVRYVRAARSRLVRYFLFDATMVLLPPLLQVQCLQCLQPPSCTIRPSTAVAHDTWSRRFPRLPGFLSFHVIVFVAIHRWGPQPERALAEVTSRSCLPPLFPSSQV
jgi:hypothetical protein